MLFRVLVAVAVVVLLTLVMLSPCVAGHADSPHKPQRVARKAVQVFRHHVCARERGIQAVFSRVCKCRGIKCAHHLLVRCWLSQGEPTIRWLPVVSNHCGCKTRYMGTLEERPPCPNLAWSAREEAPDSQPSQELPFVPDNGGEPVYPCQYFASISLDNERTATGY